MSNPRDLERLARKVNPGGWAIESARPIATLLGSCVAACLWDPTLRTGGLLASDLMGPGSRKVILDPQSGEVFCKRGQTSQSVVEAERSYASTLFLAPKKTDIELF